jgi:hypothetical protein
MKEGGRCVVRKYLDYVSVEKRKYGEDEREGEGQRPVEGQNPNLKWR